MIQGARSEGHRWTWSFRPVSPVFTSLSGVAGEPLAVAAGRRLSLAGNGRVSWMGGWVPFIGWFARAATAEGRRKPIVYDEVIGPGLQVRWNRRQTFIGLHL